MRDTQSKDTQVRVQNTHLGKDGDVHTSVHTYWTQKGRLFIYDLLKENGVLPLVEQMQEMA